MKMEYVKPEIEVIYLGNDDIVTCSNAGGPVAPIGPGHEPGHEPLPGPGPNPGGPGHGPHPGRP